MFDKIEMRILKPDGFSTRPVSRPGIFLKDVDVINIRLIPVDVPDFKPTWLRNLFNQVKLFA